MRNLKFAFLGLSKRLTFSILTIIQLSFALVLLYSSIYLYVNVNSNNNNLLKYFNNKIIYTLKNYQDYYPDFFKDEEPKKYEQYYNYLNSSKGFINVSYAGTYLLIKNFKSSQKFIMTTNYSTQKGTEKFVAANSLIISDKYLDNFPLLISQGRTFGKNDFIIQGNQTPIPVILGSNYNGIFKLGDEWEYMDKVTNEIKRIKVIGFLKNNQFFADAALGNITSLENFIVFPLEKIQRIYSDNKDQQKQLNVYYKSNLYNAIMNSVIIIPQKNKKNEHYIIQNIEEEAHKIGFFDIKAISSKEQLDRQKTLLEEQNMLIYAMFIIILAMCCIGIVANMLNSIIKRYKEFGIHILTGASTFNIGIRILLEVFLLIFVSLCFSFIGVVLLKNSHFIEFQLSTSLWLVGASLLLTILISAIPVLYVINIQISNLLRRAE